MNTRKIDFGFCTFNIQSLKYDNLAEPLQLKFILRVHLHPQSTILLRKKNRQPSFAYQIPNTTMFQYKSDYRYTLFWLEGFTFIYDNAIITRRITGGSHDDVIKWKHFPRYWPFVRGIHRSPVNSPHKGQWRGALMFSLICARINGWVNNGETSGLRRHRAHYDVILM